MADNKQIKDGLGDLFTLRMKDVSPLSDGSLLYSLFLTTLYPIDYGGAGQGGLFQYCAKSGVLNAGMTAGSSIFSFFWASASMLALIQRARLQVWSSGTAFAGGLATFDVFAARNYTATDAGGSIANLAGANNRLRTSMGSSEAEITFCSTLPLSAGSRTLDPAPLDSRTIAVPTTANTLFSSAAVTLFEKLQGEHPLLCATNEGLIVEATVPGTGTWQYALTLEWAEVPLY